MSTYVDKLNYLKQTKEAIKNALIEKNIIISDTDTFRSYAEKILSIQGGISQEEYDAIVAERDNLSKQVIFLNNQLIDLQRQLNVITPDYEYSVETLDNAYELSNTINGEEV